MMAMQAASATVLKDVAERAFYKSVRHHLLFKFIHAYLKDAVKDRNDADAKHAHIFHEKILSGWATRRTDGSNLQVYRRAL